MVGQAKLLQQLSSYTISTLPHTMLFIGDVGCGKHTVIKDIAAKFNFNLVIIDEKISHDDLISFQQDPISKLYLIDLTKFNEKQQNQFLKFIEEPSPYVYICLIANSEIGLLPTILNRCIKFIFAPYTINELKQVSKFTNTLIYDVCKTPGQLLAASDRNINELYNLCSTIVSKFNIAPYANAMSIATKINYAEEYNKFNFFEFFNMLKYVAFQDYLKNNSKMSFDIYKYTTIFYQQMINKNVVKEYFVLNFLNNLWELAH